MELQLKEKNQFLRMTLLYRRELVAAGFVISRPLCTQNFCSVLLGAELVLVLGAGWRNSVTEMMKIILREVYKECNESAPFYLSRFLLSFLALSELDR